MSFIERKQSFTGILTLTNDPATTAVFSVSNVAGALVLVKTASAGATTLKFLARVQESSTGYELTASDGTTITQTIGAGKAFQLREELYAARYISPVIVSADAQNATIIVGTKS